VTGGGKQVLEANSAKENAAEPESSEKQTGIDALRQF
jgi:hypothetical protein